MTRSAGDHRGAFGSDQEKCGHVVILVGLSGLAESVEGGGCPPARWRNGVTVLYSPKHPGGQPWNAMPESMATSISMLPQKHSRSLPEDSERIAVSR